MKIDYRIAGAGGGYTSLMDMTKGDTLEPWAPKYSAKVQVDPLASNANIGGSVKIKPQGNIVNQLALHNMTVTYATPDAALAASRTVPTAMLNNKIVLRVTEGAEVQYFPSAVCSSIIPNLQGKSVTYNMDFVTQMVTTEEPA